MVFPRWVHGGPTLCAGWEITSSVLMLSFLRRKICVCFRFQLENTGQINISFDISFDRISFIYIIILCPVQRKGTSMLYVCGIN